MEFYDHWQSFDGGKVRNCKDFSVPPPPEKNHIYAGSKKTLDRKNRFNSFYVPAITTLSIILKNTSDVQNVLQVINARTECNYLFACLF